MKAPQRAAVPVCYIGGQILLTRTDAWAYLILPPVSWAFLSDKENEQQVLSSASAFTNLRTPSADLDGREAMLEAFRTVKLTTKLPPVAELHIRTVCKRHSPQDWAARLSTRTPAPGYDRHLARVLDVISGKQYWEKITFLGVRLGTRDSRKRGKILSRPADEEIEEWSRRAYEIGITLGSSELRARHATTAELAWLIRHTASGSVLDLAPLPALDAYGPDDVAALLDAAVKASRSLTEITAAGVSEYRTVLTFSDFPKEMIYPNGGPPWASLSDNPAFPVEFSARLLLIDPAQTQKDVRNKLVGADEEAEHIAGAGARIPLALRERADDAQMLQHALSQQGNPLAYATHRLIISAPDPGLCLARARAISRDYNQDGIKLKRLNWDQRALHFESLPGGTPRGKLHVQHQPVTTIAGGMPWAAETLGDATGPYLGTAKTQAESPVFWSPFEAARRNRPTVAAILGPPGGGKALALDTRIPVPGGWATMGELKDGDRVFGADGHPCTVTRAWPVRYDRPCYDVEFSDGTTVTADAEHLWFVHTWASRQSEQSANRRGPGLGDWRDQSAKRSQPQVLTTAQMLGSVRVTADRRANYSVQVADALQAPDADLSIPSIPPYMLGSWLGDGTTTTGVVTSADAEIISEIEAEGEVTWPIPSSVKVNHAAYRIEGLSYRLRNLGVLGNKHIPIQYLRASETQRRALLAGLLDTDGYCRPNGTIEFYSTLERLARETAQLISSLGYKCTLNSKTATLNGKDCGLVWRVTFKTADKAFWLTRKLARQVTRTGAENRHRYITDIRPVPSVPVRCVTVDSPDSLYLVSEACIPTHNSFTTARICLDSAVTAGATVVVLDPIKKELQQMAPLVRAAGLPVSVIAIDEHHPGLLDPFSFGGSLGEKVLRAAETLLLLLPDTVGDAEKASRQGAVLRAVEAVADGPDPSLHKVIGWLADEAGRRKADGDSSRVEENLATELKVLSRMPLGSLCFAAAGTEPLNIIGQTTILMFSGLDLPAATTPPGAYRMSERLSVGVYYLATEYVRQLFAADRSVPKLLVIDEAWALTRTPQGQALIEAMSRMGRSHNIAMLLASHNVVDLLDERITGCISTVLAVKNDADQEVRAVFGQLGIEDTSRNRTWLAGLEKGGVIMRDLDGRIGIVQIDDGGPEFLRGMDTNPTRPRESTPELEKVTT